MWLNFDPQGALQMPGGCSQRGCLGADEFHHRPLSRACCILIQPDSGRGAGLYENNEIWYMTPGLYFVDSNPIKSIQWFCFPSQGTLSVVDTEPHTLKP